MAVLSPIRCEACGTNSHVSHRPGDAPPKVCNWCARQAAEKTREQALAEIASLPLEERLRRVEAWIIASLPLEERLRRVEAWIYDYRAPKPLSETMF